MKCEVAYCEKEAVTSEGYCHMHHKRKQRNGTLENKKFLKDSWPVCSIEGCDRPVRAKGFCNAHYNSWKRYGDPLKAKRVGSDGGWTGTRTHNTYKNMVKRCYYSGHSSYKWYGAKGIGVCDRWRASFYNFLEDMGQAPEGMTLDRIDRNEDYGPDNCRWATPAEQIQNSSSAKMTQEDRDKARDLAASGWRYVDIATILGVSATTVSNYIKGESWN